MADKTKLSIEEAARWLGVSSRTAYRLAQAGRIPAFKVGGQWRFSEKMLEEWMADQVTIKRLQVEETRRRSA